MFASLKNKIKEETGSDLSKLTSKITSSTVQRIDSLRGKSHQGSSSSINSIVSLERDDNSFDNEEFRKRLQKIETDYMKKLEQKDSEYRSIISEKDKHLQHLEKEKDDALKLVKELKTTLKCTEESKQKIVEHQLSLDQIESLQTQEMLKIKNLVLTRDTELSDKTAALKEATAQLEKLRLEVSRLRQQEEHLSDVQDDLESLRHSSARDLASLAAQLAKSEEERRHLTDLVAILRQRLSNETSDDEHFKTERKLLEQRLEEAHLHLADIKTSWSDKIASLETQVGRLSRQAAEESAERRRAVQEKEAIVEKMRQLEAELECRQLELVNKETKIKRLTTDIEELTNEIRALRAETEEEVSFLRTKLDESTTEIKTVRKNLENSETELNKIENERVKLKESYDLEQESNKSLRQLINKLEKELNEERNNSLNVQKTLSRVTSEKNTALLRNAEISQQMELVKQEKRRQETEMTELINKLNHMEDENNKFKEMKTVEQRLRNTITELEEQISEKNKNIKTLQLRLADMKKTLQQELRTSPAINQFNHHNNDLFNDNTIAILQPSQISTRNYQQSTTRRYSDNNNASIAVAADDDVNFKYLKHVVIKFLTCREYEAHHLIKAISTVLKFTPDEERLVIETFEWKRSWFGSKPKLSTITPISNTTPMLMPKTRSSSTSHS